MGVKCQLCRQRAKSQCARELADLTETLATMQAACPITVKLWLAIGNALNFVKSPNPASVDAYRRAIIIQRNFKSGGGITAEERLVQVLRDLSREREAKEECSRL